MHLLVFPVSPVRPRFDFPSSRLVGRSEEDLEEFPYPDWSTDHPTSDTLTDRLNRQVAYELEQRGYLGYELCGQGQPFQVEYPDVCEKWLSTLKHRADVYRIDYRVFDPDQRLDYDVIPYAVVLIEQGRYYGHVYAWVSPKQPERCWMIGIRNRIDTLFLRVGLGGDHSISGVAPILVEGVRRFAAVKGCSMVTVYNPLPPMYPILDQAGFVEDHPSMSTVGISPAMEIPLPGACRQCRSRFDTLTPIVDVKVGFVLME